MLANLRDRGFTPVALIHTGNGVAKTIWLGPGRAPALFLGRD
ncbi:hypothetical protein SAMN05892883_2226 [Jatrophihabitans sp. GAS493]|nr:hypothetical protein SAMN05892883_2226 [Jatrophihabitans sp. GAS493]